MEKGITENYVCIGLKPYLFDYLKHLTSSEKPDIRVSRSNTVGRLFYSLIRKSESPIEKTFEYEKTTIFLPEVRYAHLDRKFLYLPKDAEQTICDFLEAHFDTTFFKFMSLASDLNIMQKDAIQLFLRAYKFRENSLTFDALKKKDYRKRKKIEEFLLLVLQNSDI